MSSALIACLRSRDTTSSVPSRVPSFRVASFMLRSHFLCSRILAVCAGAGRGRVQGRKSELAGSDLFSRLVQKAMLGEEVIISKDNKLALKLVPLDKPKRPRKP